ncbi:MAG: hypothetical protein AB1656_02670 [Candidatus Omnitrophota bacterium]
MKTIDRFDAGALAVWGLVLLASFILLGYLAANPRKMLWIETGHPSAAYGAGDEWLRKGEYAKAIREYERGRDYFKELYEKDRLDGHRKQIASGMLRLANACCVKRGTEALAQAVRYYDEAIALERGMSEGQPYLARGDALLQLERYEEAAASYTEAIERGRGKTSLRAIYGRGVCYAEMNSPERAADDWHFFLRYSNGIAKNELERIAALPESGNPHWKAVVGGALLLLGEKSRALSLLEEYTAAGADDRFGKYLLAEASDRPFPEDEGAIGLEQCFPSKNEAPRQLGSAWFDLYAAQSGKFLLTAGLSSAATGIALPQAAIRGKNEKILVVESAESRSCALTIELDEGKNLIEIRANRQAGSDEEPAVYLHSLELRRETEINDE